MSYGFDPYLSSWSPFHGAVYAIISSVAKIVASGGDYSKIRFTFQEYFRRLGSDPKRWGEPLAALLGAYDAQIKLGLAAIGGKDSMSGTFNDIDVPPTLVSFAVAMARAGDIVTPEFKNPGNAIVRFKVQKDTYDLPVYEQVKSLYGNIYKLMKDKKAVSAYALGFGGTVEAVSKMAFGNMLGVALNSSLKPNELFLPDYGSIIAEIKKEDMDLLPEYGFLPADYDVIGEVTAEKVFKYGDEVVAIDEAYKAWSRTLESVYPTRTVGSDEVFETKLFDAGKIYVAKNRVAKPKVFIPVFPGTNCEYDTIKAFEAAGAETETVVFANMNADDIRESVKNFERAIRRAQIIMFAGGFSAGDEPDGSGKFAATIFRNESIKEAVNDLLYNRDGLALGICNGFQILIKLGLLPYGEIRPQEEDSPTLVTNKIGRHVSKIVYTKVVSNASPWLMKAQLGGIYAIPSSHGEGRFVASREWIDRLFKNGQVATQYVDLNGNPAMDDEYNPNGSYYAIEGIVSPDGRVFGKMAHSERIGDYVAVNITGNQNQYIFESGVSYFR